MTRPSDTKTDDTVAAAVEEFRTYIAGELLDLVYETEPESIRTTVIANWISRLNTGHDDALSAQTLTSVLRALHSLADARLRARLERHDMRNEYLNLDAMVRPFRDPTGLTLVYAAVKHVEHISHLAEPEVGEILTMGAETFNGDELDRVMEIVDEIREHPTGRNTVH